MTHVNLKFIDSGAFGDIYKIVKEETNYKIKLKKQIIDENKIEYQNICIKICSLSNGSKEFEYLKNFDHRNIIKILFGYFDIDNNMYIIGMNLMNGNVFNNTNIITDINQFINQILSGIKYIHDSNIVHCDIKPQNILFKKYSNDIIFYITDFNSAYIYKNNTQHIKFKYNEDNKIIGTLNFCSLFCLLKCNPYRRDDLESFFISCLYIVNNDLDKNIFIKETDQKILRKFRLCLYQYKTIQVIRSYKFYQDLDYDNIKQLLFDDFNKMKNISKI